MLNKQSLERGAAAVEASISIILLLTILILSIEMSLYLYSSIGLQYTVSNTARWASLGKKVTSNNVQLSREDSIANTLKENGKIFTLNFSNAVISLCPTNITSCSTLNAGGPNESISLKVDIPFRFFLWRKSVTLSTSVIFRNEPYV